MHATFRFFEHDVTAPRSQNHISLNSPGIQFQFKCVDDSALDRGNYGAHSYRAVTLDVDRDQMSDPNKMAGRPVIPAAMAVNCRSVRKGRGATPSAPGDILFITTCQVDSKDTQQFLEQFDTASRYMLSRPGIVRFHLFQSLSSVSLFQFISVAQWSSMIEFVDAFRQPAFKGLLTGGFDHESQIIVARNI